MIYCIVFLKLFFLNLPGTERNAVRRNEENGNTITVHFVILYKENICLKVLNLTHKTFLFLGDDGDTDGK